MFLYPVSFPYGLFDLRGTDNLCNVLFSQGTFKNVHGRLYCAAFTESDRSVGSIWIPFTSSVQWRKRTGEQKILLLVLSGTFTGARSFMYGIWNLV